MELLACAAPQGALVSAPPTALCVNTSADRWDGYWGEDDNYYVRRTRLGSGQTEWFCLGDSAARTARSHDSAAGGVAAGVDRDAARRRVRVLVGRRVPGGAGRRILLFRVR